MSPELLAQVQASPQYRTLVAERRRLSLVLTVLIFVAYYGYIALIAFDRTLMAKPIGGGVMSVGIPLGLGLIAFTVAITGAYVWRANARFDKLTSEILKEFGESTGPR